MIRWYLDYLNMILLRPILFYATMPEEDFRDKPITFCAATSWILAFFLTVMLFLNKLITIGATITEGMHGFKLLLVTPVMAVLAFIFFMMLFIIIGGLLMIAMLALFYLLGAALFWGSKWLGAEPKYGRSIQAALYSGAIIVVGILVAVLAILANRGILDFAGFRVGCSFVYWFAVLYLYGLLAIAARKIEGLPKSKAFLAALLPGIILIILGIIAGKLVLPKIESLI